MTYRCTRLLQAQWCWRQSRQHELQLTRRMGTVLRSSARERQRPQHHLLCAYIESAGGLCNDEYTNEGYAPLDCSTALIEELETEKAADGCRESYDLPEQALRQTNMESRL